MIRKAMLCISVVGGLAGLTAQPSSAGAFTSGNRDLVMASSEKTSAEATPQRPRARAGHHWRHQGGRHPFYGSGHRQGANR
jgi:hypothetical protein